MSASQNVVGLGALTSGVDEHVFSWIAEGTCVFILVVACIGVTDRADTQALAILAADQLAVGAGT